MRTVPTALVTFMVLVIGLLPASGCDPEEAEALAAIDVDSDELERCDRPARDYVSVDPEFCSEVLFVCGPGAVVFNDMCGCGCEALPESPAPKLGATAVAGRP